MDAVNEDYLGNRFQITFPVGSQSVTFDIPIVNDTVFEGQEFFNLRIVIPQEAADIGVEPGVPIDAFVDITDEESESRRYRSMVEPFYNDTKLCPSVVL